jgi:hypothetical protein
MCLYASPDERLKSNAACLLALYLVSAYMQITIIIAVAEVAPSSRRYLLKNFLPGKSTHVSRKCHSFHSETQVRVKRITD